ncbi:MAG TPA: carboxypeptidase regulatory-like domain-containing protein, partial [Thermoanaerobaculia bacterium]
MRALRQILEIATAGLVLAAGPGPARALADEPCAHGPGSGIVLSGAVADERGRPVAGATVRAMAPLDNRSPAVFCSSETVTSRGGEFSFELPRIHSNYRLVAFDAAHAPALATAPGAPGGPARSIRLRLERGRTGRGRVVDEAGRPVAGARVELRRSRLDRGEYRRPETSFPDDDLYRATTGADGRFALARLPVTSRGPAFEVAVHAAGFVPASWDTIAVKRGDAADAENVADTAIDLGTYTLATRPASAGRVTDPGGRPIAGAEVWALHHERPWQEDRTPGERAAGPAARTDGDGRFLLRGAGEELWLVVCHAGFVAEEKPLSGLSGSPAIVLTPAAELAGRVVDGEGRPVPGARVAYPDPSPYLDVALPPGTCSPPYETATDASGRFGLPGVPPGWQFLSAEAPGYTASGRRFQARAGGRLAGIELPLSRGTSVEGRVLADDGAPVAGARIAENSPGFLAEAVADGDGRFRLAVAPGPHDVWVSRGGFAGGGLHRLMAPPEGGHLDVTLKRYPEEIVARRVIGPRGEPIANARVWSYEGPDLAITDEDGRFAMAGYLDDTPPMPDVYALRADDT